MGGRNLIAANGSCEVAIQKAVQTNNDTVVSEKSVPKP